MISSHFIGVGNVITDVFLRSCNSINVEMFSDVLRYTVFFRSRLLLPFSSQFSLFIF